MLLLGGFQEFVFGSGLSVKMTGVQALIDLLRAQEVKSTARHEQFMAQASEVAKCQEWLLEANPTSLSILSSVGIAIFQACIGHAQNGGLDSTFPRRGRS